MVRCIAVAAALALLAAGPGQAQPAPSFLGSTGLIFTPTADVVGMAEFAVGGAVAQTEDSHTSWISANVGVLPQLELGATRAKPEHAGAETMLNAKVRLMKPPLTATTVSVGVLDIADRVNRSAYAVLTHEVGAGLVLRRGLLSRPRVHVGVGGGQYDGVFAAGEITYADQVKLIAEYDSRQLNLAARIQLSKSAEVTAAALDGATDFGVGVAFSSPW